jgi:hypothetical protein
LEISKELLKSDVSEFESITENKDQIWLTGRLRAPFVWPPAGQTTASSSIIVMWNAAVQRIAALHSALLF